MTSILERQARLVSLKAAYRVDMHPAIRRLRLGTTYVAGQGPLLSKYAFIGEAPGANEERMRIPFCGASGRVLGDLLTSVGLDRPDVYVTNVVKYRPPNNRDPKPDEIAVSLPYLREELRAIGSQFLVTLGRHALHALAPDLKIAEVHGRWQRIQGWPWLLPLYHPAVGLYNPNMMPILQDDFKKVTDMTGLGR